MSTSPLRRLLVPLLVAACGRQPAQAPAAEPPETPEPAVTDPTRAERERMVDWQLAGRDITDPAVLAAMRVVPRHVFVPEPLRHLAYEDFPLPIGLEQTISQPYIVALMTQLARVAPGERVLDIGTGSGYQAAVLSEIGADVYTIEIVPSLAESAKKALHEAGYARVHTRTGDGYGGWPEAAPFDAIVLAASPDHVPEPLKEQLAVGGRLVLPVGTAGYQELRVLERTAHGIEETVSIPVMFVPMTGEALKR